MGGTAGTIGNDVSRVNSLVISRKERTPLIGGRGIIGWE